MPLRTPPRWFVKELGLIDEGLKVRWSDRIQRWFILHADNSLSLKVEHPRTHAYRDLDMRTIRKLRINAFFTHNANAFDIFLDDTKEEKEKNSELRAHITRGIDGISDYLSGWDKED